MKDTGRLFWLIVGMAFGAAAVAVYLSPSPTARAANDRFEDYVMCTGAVGLAGRGSLDGVWLLDYRSGKLLGTVIDKSKGKIIGWAEVDLVTEFGIQPRQNVHFLMTCGQIAQGQAALYIAESTTGKFGVYSMAARGDNQQGVAIQRHDLVLFRQAAAGHEAPKEPK
jgi:hypothetical protein